MHVRSLLRYCSSAVAIGVAVMGPAMVIASGSCKTLSDKDSKFVEALVSMYEIPNEIWKDFPLENAIGPFEQDFPWISSCLANIDIPTLYFNVSSNKAIERCEQEMSSEEYICPLYRNKLVPCVNDIVLRTITDALDSTNGCCDALKTKVVESFGRDITPMANALMDLAGDIVCSNKTYATENGNEVTEACVDSIYRVINNERMDEFVVNMLQTPENQVCAAVTGAPYKTTTGKSAQLFTSFDACYTPIASLIQHIASYPIVKNMVSYDGNVKMTDMFQGSGCVDIGKLVEWAVSEKSMVQEIFGMVDNAVLTFGVEPDYRNTSDTMTDSIRNMGALMDGMCIHIPSAVSECNFKAKFQSSLMDSNVGTSSATYTTMTTSGILALTMSTLLSLLYQL